MQRFDLIFLATMVMVAAFVFNRCDLSSHSDFLKPPAPEGIILNEDTARVQGYAIVRIGPAGHILIDPVEAPEKYRRWLEINEYEFEYITIDSSSVTRIDSLSRNASIVPGEMVYSKEIETRDTPEKKVTTVPSLI